MLKLADKLDLSTLSQHLGIRLLDKVFSLVENGSIQPSQFDLISHGCLMLAAKFNELDYKVPLLCDISAITRYKLNYYSLKQIEQDLLPLLDFDFMQSVPLTLLNLHLS
jgi:hypothetical protein